MKNFKIIVYFFSLILLGTSCVKYDIKPSPAAKIKIDKTVFNVKENISFINEGSGEYFSFWPGDPGHVYSKRANGIDKGLTPNDGKNFSYSYLYTGTFTIVMVASSYDEENSIRTEKIDSVTITIVAGSTGNTISSIEIYNCISNYNSVGRFVGGDSILFPLGFPNRAKGGTDSLFVALANSRSFLFNAGLASVYADKGYLLTNKPNDIYTCNLIAPVSYDPLVYNSIVKTLIVKGQGETPREYKIAAMFYPEMFSFSVGTKNAIAYSTDGIGVIRYNTEDTTMVGPYASKAVMDFAAANEDSLFFGIKIKTPSPSTKEYDAIPTFSVSPGCIVTLNGVQQISGVTSVHFVKKQALYYKVTKKQDGFAITTNVAIYVN